MRQKLKNLVAYLSHVFNVRLPSCFHVTSLNSGYAKGYDSGMQVRTGLLAISSSGQTSSASGTLAPGTYDWYVRSNVEHWTAYKIEADGKVYAEADAYKGNAQNWLGGTFTINHKFNASVYAYAYGSGTHCVAINRH